MKLRYKIAVGFLIFVGIAFTSLGITLSYTADCLPASAPGEGKPTMQAIIYSCYGSTDVLERGTVARPEPEADQLLIKVRAAGVNPLDWHYMRGTPYIMRLGSGIGAPRDNGLGVDFSGTVEAVGKQVKKFKPGDAVFGGTGGAFAQYVTVGEDHGVTLMPANVTFEQAAGVPIAAVSALQALRDKGNIQAGQKVLINGASGGVGTFAVQIAKSFGAEVTGVCSARNAEMVRSLGADHVIDYKREDYTEDPGRYDLIIDMVGNHSMSENRRALVAGGTLVSVGGAKGDDWIGPLISPLTGLVMSPFVDEKLQFFIARMKQADLVYLGRLMQQGKMTTVIDRTYPLSEVAAAIEYSEAGHARGKIIIQVGN